MRLKRQQEAQQHLHLEDHDYEVLCDLLPQQSHQLGNGNGSRADADRRLDSAGALSLLRVLCYDRTTGKQCGRHALLLRMSLHVRICTPIAA
jgi:hypothetical protein